MYENEMKTTSENGISINDVIGAIKSAKEFLENNPGVVNAANYVVQNGIKEGGYNVVKAAINNVMENGGEQGVMRAALNGLNDNFKGSGDMATDVKQLGACAINRNNQRGTAPISAKCITYDADGEYDDGTVTDEFEVSDVNEPGEEYQPAPAQQNINQPGMMMVGVGGVGTIAKVMKYADQVPSVLSKANDIMESTVTQLDRMSGNVVKVKDSGSKLLASMRKKPAAQNVAQYADDALQYVDDAAELVNTGLTETAIQGASSTLQKSLSSAAKGGAIGAFIGVTMETVMSYKKWKKGEITEEEYTKEIAKSGGQYGISGAATAGITTAITPVLSAVAGTMGVACPVVTIPVSIAIGSGIDKIIGPAFGRGDYKKILDDCKYYQNLAHAHDDLVQAIAMAENQFVDFIDQYQHQMEIHNQLSDRNRQINQLHGVANARLQQQNKQLNTTMSSLNDLLNKI